MVEPVRYQGPRRAKPQGPGLPIRGGQPGQQERAPPRLQPRAREGAGAPPRRQARLRVPGHRGVYRRGLPGQRPLPPPRRPVPPRRRPLLGLLRRRQGINYRAALPCTARLQINFRFRTDRLTPVVVRAAWIAALSHLDTRLQRQDERGQGRGGEAGRGRAGEV